MNDPEAYDKKQELEAMAITARAMIMYAERHAGELDKRAVDEQDPQRRNRIGANGSSLPKGSRQSTHHHA